MKHKVSNTFCLALILSTSLYISTRASFPPLVKMMMTAWRKTSPRTTPRISGRTLWASQQMLRTKTWPLPDSTDSIPGANRAKRCRLTAEPKEPGLRGTYQRMDPTRGIQAKERRFGGLRGMETRWTVQARSETRDKVQDDLRRPPSSSLEVAVWQDAAAFSPTYSRCVAYVRQELATEGQSQPTP